MGTLERRYCFAKDELRQPCDAFGRPRFMALRGCCRHSEHRRFPSYHAETRLHRARDGQHPRFLSKHLWHDCQPVEERTGPPALACGDSRQHRSHPLSPRRHQENPRFRQLRPQRVSTCPHRHDECRSGDWRFHSRRNPRRRMALHRGRLPPMPFRFHRGNHKGRPRGHLFRRHERAQSRCLHLGEPQAQGQQDVDGSADGGRRCGVQAPQAESRRKGQSGGHTSETCFQGSVQGHPRMGFVEDQPR